MRLEGASSSDDRPDEPPLVSSVREPVMGGMTVARQGASYWYPLMAMERGDCGVPQRRLGEPGLDSDSLGDGRLGVSLSGCRLDEAAGGGTPVHGSSVARAGADALRCRPARRASRCRARDESTTRCASRDAATSCHSSSLGRGTTDLLFPAQTVSKRRLYG